MNFDRLRIRRKIGARNSLTETNQLTMSKTTRGLRTMKYHAVFFVSLIALLPASSAFSDPQSSSASEANNAIPKIQKSSESGTINTISAIQKPSESEAIETAIAYLNREGRLTIQGSEFLAWGTFSEEYAYWPIKFRLSYKRKGSDVLRQNEYAVKISKDSNGKWKAEQYYAWRSDFK